jgi:hypothetical protein
MIKTEINKNKTYTKDQWNKVLIFWKNKQIFSYTNKGKKEETQINKSWNEKGDIATSIRDSQMIIRKCCE